MATVHKFRLNDKVKILNHTVFLNHTVSCMVGKIGIISEREDFGGYSLRHSDGTQSAWYRDKDLELIAHDCWQELDAWEDLDGKDEDF